MLINGKVEELKRYSKVNYVAGKFIEKAKEVWEYSELQIRSIYLISDLAKNDNGVFSVAYSTFKKMFEQRFKMEISLSSVRRFFALMEKLGLLSKNEAKRKNNSQSANVYIVEQQMELQQDEQPLEHPSEDLNISFQEINDEHKTLNNNVVNSVEQSEIINDVYLEYRSKGVNKSVFQKVLSQILEKKNIRNLKAYIKSALNKVVEYVHKRIVDNVLIH
ncbi:hypothetical protein [Gottfriedia acidiceleris]|uniref:hypothetical protein n=1 Tax=Gottfriedia acidiceleris TaxID=371036 RepID=UPI00101BADB2|nr:hypothetical protein [Gottfriedia acidiceleris]